MNKKNQQVAEVEETMPETQIEDVAAALPSIDGDAIYGDINMTDSELEAEVNFELQKRAFDASREQKITEKISVKYVFSPEEIGEKGVQLGRLHQNVEQIRDELREIASTKKSQIDQSNAQINELSRHVTNGYTYVDEVCSVRLMDPGPGQKSYYRISNGEFVETRPMQPMDYQSKMQFDLGKTQSEIDDQAIAEMDMGKNRLSE